MSNIPLWKLECNKAVTEYSIIISLFAINGNLYCLCILWCFKWNTYQTGLGAVMIADMNQLLKQINFTMEVEALHGFSLNVSEPTSFSKLFFQPSSTGLFQLASTYTTMFSIMAIKRKLTSKIILHTKVIVIYVISWGQYPDTYNSY